MMIHDEVIMKNATSADTLPYLFKLNYLRMYQFKADNVAEKIGTYEYLMDEIQDFRHMIIDVRKDAEGDGLTRDERSSIRLYQHSIEQDLGVIDRMPDISTLHDRLDFLEHRIDHHAEVWGIDTW
jgi:hypothetical protein